jgi:hypothetical protein
MNRFKDAKDGGRPPAGWLPATERKGITFSVFGAGTWAEEDEPKLYKMFYPRYPDGINPFTLNRVIPRKEKEQADSTTKYVPNNHLDGLYLCNLASAYQCHPDEIEWKDVGTTRVYRLYNLQAESPGGLVLDRRVDFELRYSSSRDEGGGREYNDATLSEILSTLPLAKEPAVSGVEVWSNNTCKALSKFRRQLSAEAGRLSSKTERAFDLIERAIREFSKKAESKEGMDPLPEPQCPFEYVVVKDLGKGTVTPVLLEALREKGLINDQTQWFISSKQRRPSYLHLLVPPHHYGKIRLLFLPPMAIAQIGQDSDHFVNNWFIDGKEPTSEGLSKLEELHQTYHSRRLTQGVRIPTLVVAMPKGLSILAVEDQKGDDLIGYDHPKPLLNEVDEELTGRASMFFAALTAQLIREDREYRGRGSTGRVAPVSFDERSESRCEMLEIALKASYDVVRGNINALKNFGSDRRGSQNEELFSFDPSLERYKRSAGVGQSSPVNRIVPFGWLDKKSKWEQSRSNAGIIKLNENPPRYFLELWRAMGELDGYIETVEERRRSITQLVTALQDFLRDTPRNSFSAMLIAEPGTGKSHLVSRLAAALDLPPLPFNITQLMTRESISACFNEIASAQARDRNRVQLVFFDEINSEIAGSTVYDLFLTVLEDGTYLRGSQRFKLDPCVWLFAGTKVLKDEPSENKEADFKSRLTIDAVWFNKSEGGSNERRALIYQGALQLQAQHTDVKKISAQVLKAFASMDLEKGNSRKIRQLAGRFRNIQYGEVRQRNLPEELKAALEARGGTTKDDFQSLLAVGQTQNPAVLDNILVEIKRYPDKDDYRDSLTISREAPL